MQGTFTERWEGGNPHRHVRINDGRDITTNSLHHRPEAWKIVLPPTVHSLMQFRGHADSTIPASGIDAPYYRDFIAKRPVVIKNILQTTATVDTRLDGALFHGPVGNYSHQYDVLQTSGRTANNKYFVEQQGVGFGYTSQTLLPGLLPTPEISFVRNLFYDYQLAERKTTDTVFVERFSAPGSYEAMSRGYLDPFAEEMSAYNAMPFRNLSVRGFGAHKKQVQTLGVEISTNTWSTSSLGLKSLLSRRTVFGGYDNQASTTPAFHKTYRNRLRRIEMRDGATYLNPDGTVNQDYATGSTFDNGFITHMIPRSDFQYSWITASVLSQDPSNGFGLGYFPYSGKVSSSAGGFESAVNFASASDFGAVGSSGVSYGYGITLLQAIGTGTRFLPVDFAGLNTIVVADSTQFSDNTIQNGLLDNGQMGPNGIGESVLLNAGLLNAGGGVGFPTFKQIRNMYHPIARHLKDTNTYSISVRNKKTPVSAGGIPYGPEQIVFPKLNVKIVGNEASYKNQQGTPHLLVGSEVTIENYIEPPLSSKFKPIRHDVNVEDENAQVSPLIIEHTYTNNFDYFANPNLMKKMENAGVIEQPGQQIYDNLLEYTIKGTIPKNSNPIKGFRNLIYKETIYPKEQHTYLAKSRGRTSYTQEVLTLTGILGSDRTFWRDSLGDRQRSIELFPSLIGPTCAKNPLGFLEQAHSLTPPVVGTPRPEWVAAPSIHPLDGGDRMTGATIDYSQLTGSNHGALSVDSFSTSMLQYQIDRTTFMAPTSSFAYEYHAFISSSAAEGEPSDGEIYSEFIPNWDTQRLSGKKPWFDSYEEYASDIRLMGQDHTVLPEFRISQHMDYYLDKGGFFGATSKNNKFLTLEGGHLSQSAASETSEYDANFYDVYSHSDFLKHFELIRTQHEESLGDHKQTKMTIKCRGIKKLLPYNGFYPMNRTVQLGSMMSQSFAPFLEGSTIFSSNPNAERISAFMQPFFNPGIMYNTIKSGIAVDWMTFTGSVHITKFGTSTQGGVIHTNTGSFRLPFESIIFPEKYLAASGSSPVNSTPTHINYVDARMHTGAPRISGAFARWTGDSKPNYSLAVNNFIAEIPNFFLKERK